MFKRICIANRGEVAVRIIRACKELGIETVAIYSSADADALHTQLATFSVCVGSARSTDSYLNISNILSAAIYYHCDAVHPGFGFLSENAAFARMVEQCGMVFVGPPASVMEMMGDKSKAKQAMREAGIPVVEGSQGVLSDAAQASELADRIGYPVILKAAYGGGGRGMRIVEKSDEVNDAFEIASTEAKNAFGNGDMYLEKYVRDPKHIEFQLLGDAFGNVVHLFERDCSIQRRNQKLIEESPSRFLDDDLRHEMGNAAVKAAKSIGYQNAGTIEFLVDKDRNFYFMEMNTRLQVEHGVTEMVTGVDIVKEQFRIASGLPLSFTQDEIRLSGHAIEVRINAEDPKNNFTPAPGTLSFLHFPAGPKVRVDSAMYNGSLISPYYDSMIAKIIAFDTQRLGAIKKLRAALEECVIEGVTTNIDMQYLILHHAEFLKGNYTTSFMAKHQDEVVM
jgi:acetyl-CoA carboxylase, biotin carboxylase subunit